MPANNAPPFSINGIAGVQVVNADVGWWVGVHVDHFTVDWGDGTSPSDGTIAPTGTGATWLEGSHIYANAGTYTVNVSVFTSADATTPWHTYAAATATIAPATRRISAGAAHAIAIGFSTQAQWSLALPAPADQMPTVAIHWGDGSKPDHSATVWVSNGRAYVVASHAYSRLGRHRAVAVFSLNGKVVGRIAEVLKLQRASV
ncbi:MAG TPA: hypothetical protein VFC78_20085 [Tepidisphaeraceae bacterium]|nr:hypothetical protein [Tepidisphaeraceae bacterium]